MSQIPHGEVESKTPNIVDLKTEFPQKENEAS